MLRDNAYYVSIHKIHAAKCGVPQNRTRLILTGFLGKEDLGITAALAKLSRKRDAVIKDVLPTVKHIYFPPRLSNKQAWVISANSKCPTVTTKCLGRPTTRLKVCKANSAPLHKATILTAKDFAAIQGLPRDYPLPWTRPTVCAKLIGNLFPPPCARILAEAVTPTLQRYLQQRPVTRRAALTIPDEDILEGCKSSWEQWCHTRDVIASRHQPLFPNKCRLSEKILRKYLDKHGDDATASLLQHFTVKDIDINPKLDTATRNKITAVFLKYKDVLLKNSHELPRCVLGEDLKPFVHKITFKKGYKPTRCRSPEYVMGSAKRAILQAWCAQGVRSGLLVKVENSLWSSRVLCVAKYKVGTERSGVPDGIRICADLVRANEMKTNVVPLQPHVHLELARVAGHRYYACMDAAKGYWSFATDDASSASTAVWLPTGSTTALFRFTRATMGDTSAGTTMNSRYAEVLANHLDDNTRKHVSQMADDFCLWADSLDELLHVLDVLLGVFSKYHITINPKKVQIGYPTVEYWGWEFSKLGTRPTPRNLCPIRQMQVPQTRKQLQACLGVFNFHAGYISDRDQSSSPPRVITYRELIAPLQLLTRGKPEGTRKFKAKWGEPQQRAFDRVREILLSGVMLHAPDYTRPLRMATDASDFGYGIFLYQLKPTADGKEPPNPSDKPIVPDPDKINIIRQWSKAWTPTQRLLPVYWRESAAWMFGLKKCRPYVLTSQFPLHTLTDHLPLTWIRKSSGKHAISTFLSSQVEDVRWTIRYLPGHQNTLSDAISRPPFLGVLKPNTVGLKMMVAALLKHLPPTAVSCKHPWTYAGKDTRRLAHQIQAWRTGTNPVKICSHSAQNIASMKFDLAIIIPVAELAGTVCYNLLKRGLPMACLIPSSLLHRVPQNLDGGYDELVTRRVAKAGKICFAAGELLWVTFHPTTPAVHRVYRAVARAATTLNTAPSLDPATDIGMANTWTSTPTKSEYETASKTGLKIMRNGDGPYYVTDTNADSTRIIVPPDKRTALIDMTHRQSHHLGWAMNWALLKPNYWWPTMRKDIELRVQGCSLCKTAKGTRRAAHTHWRHRKDSCPRTSWCFDYFGMPTSSNGSREVAGAIDVATHKLILMALPNRKATVTAEAILEHICHKEGTPLRFHSDCAAELMSRTMTHLWKLQGTTATQTLGHNATGNSMIERVWRFVNAALRCLTDQQYHDWHKHLPAIAAAWNCTPNRTLGCSPFEASTGTRMRRPATALGDKQPTVPRSMNQTEITMLHKAAEAFRKLAASNQQWHSKHIASLKNKMGRWKHNFKVGDMVKIFIPPTAHEAHRRGRKAKHCHWYRGPARVVKILSPTTYTVMMCKTKRLFDRAITNISPWGPSNADDPHILSNANTPPHLDDPTTETAQASTTAYTKGDIIAVKDDATEDVYWLADVTRVKGDGLHLAYYGTHGTNLQRARFRPLYVTKRNELTFTPETGATRWTGQMSTNSLPGCVVARKLQLTKRGELSTKSFRVVNKLVNTLSHALVDKPKQ
jgi:hypothetical protein